MQARILTLLLPSLVAMLRCHALVQFTASAAPQQQQQRRQQQSRPRCERQQPAPLQRQQPAPLQQEHRRRILIGGLAALATAALPSPAQAATAAAAALAEEAPRAGPAPGSLAAKLATTGAVRQPGIQAPWAPKQLYFPRYLFGEWTVDMEFTNVSIPLGRKFVPDGFLAAAEAAPEAGGVGSRYAFRQRFYSTLPPTWDNTLRVRGCAAARLLCTRCGLRRRAGPAAVCLTVALCLLLCRRSTWGWACRRTPSSLTGPSTRGRRQTRFWATRRSPQWTTTPREC